MTFVEALILGIVQGLTEFLPISSSAHVQIAQELLGLSDITKPQLTAFIATIQLGTEAAVVIYFFKTIMGIVKSFAGSALKPWNVQDQDSKMGWLIILGTLPIVVLGLSFRDFIESDVRSLTVIAIMLIVFGLLLGLADVVGAKRRNINSLRLSDGIIFGLGQALALIPGVSRSGGSITVGLMLGFTREAAARYSFLLAIPAVIGAGGFQFASSYGDLPQDLLLATIVATIVSFVVGYLVIAWLLRYLQRGNYWPFVVWRVLVGTIILLMVAT